MNPRPNAADTHILRRETDKSSISSTTDYCFHKIDKLTIKQTTTEKDGSKTRQKEKKRKEEKAWDASNHRLRIVRTQSRENQPRRRHSVGRTLEIDGSRMHRTNLPRRRFRTARRRHTLSGTVVGTRWCYSRAVSLNPKLGLKQ